MELEAKHIYPYLAHDVKIVWDDTKDIYGITFDESTDFQNMLYPFSTLLFTLKRQSVTGLGWKPILHPLSMYCGKTIAKDAMKLLNCDVSVVHEIWELQDGTKSLDEISIKTYNSMCENHVDFYGLIEANLAVNINTIEPCTT